MSETALQAILSLLIKQIVLFLLPAFAVAGWMNQRMVQGGQHPAITAIVALGLGPAAAIALFFHLMLIAPNMPYWLYIGLVCLPFLVLFVLFFRQSLMCFGEAWSSLQKLILPIKGGALLFPVGLVLFLMAWVRYLWLKPVMEHDTLEYATQGLVFFLNPVIEYSAHRYDAATGFYYVGLHGLNFPLFSTWELMFNAAVGTTSNLLFRSLNSYYGLLIALFVFLYLRRFAPRAAWFGLAMLMLSYIFFENILKYHIDSYRLFFGVAAVWSMLECIERPQWRNFFWFGVLSGLQASAHSLGVFLSVIEFACLFLFLPLPLLPRTKMLLYAFALFFTGGALHYVLDVSIGTGWIFKEIAFF
jgi:hypothetical protein